jgi:hypothetical protein
MGDMVHTRLLILGLVLVAADAACGGGTAGPGGSGGTLGRDAGHDTKPGTTYATGTFDETTAPCLTAIIQGTDSDPQCTVVEHPGDGGAETTLASCLEDNLQPPCWALVSGQASCGGMTFQIDFGSTAPTGASFSYQCAVCPPGTVTSC